MNPRPIEPGTPEESIIVEEDGLLARVSARLAQAAIAEGPLHDYERELFELRDQVGEAKPEDVASLVEQMTRLQAISARRGRSRTLPVDPRSPYFAHLRIRDERGERDVLLGRRGFVDREGGVQIVDWRNAPVSQVYYRYEEGDDFEETFGGGQLRGEVLVRRNITISGGRLRRIGCPQGTFVRDAHGTWHRVEGPAEPTLSGGQGTAVRSVTLGGHARACSGPVEHKLLPEIAALIDREQWDRITQPQSGLVVVQGGAGSGKTTVALHRVAYLNFAAPQRFSPKRMLVVVPTVSLARYVEGVLPSLGVRGVPVVTLRSWLSGTRRRLVPAVGSRYAEDTPEAAGHVKKHPTFLRLVESLVTTQAEAVSSAISEIANEEPSVEEALSRWQELAALPLCVRLRRMAAWLGDEGRVPHMPAPVRHRLGGLLVRFRRRAQDLIRDYQEMVTDLDLMTRAFADERDVTVDEIQRTVAWCSQNLSKADEDPVGVDPERLVPVDGGAQEEPAAGRLDSEDDAPLLRLHQLKYGGLVDRNGHEARYEHVVIDEAQDLAVVELKVLLEATTPLRSVTIAGDAAQRFVFDNGFRDFGSLLRDAGAGSVELSPLMLSYRSTAQVMQFARAVLGPLQDPEAPLCARSGAEVGFFRFGETGEAVAFVASALRSLFAREPTASTAIIARYPEQADLWYEALARAEVPSLRRVARHDFSFAPGVDATDVTQVKGLEFDYVIVVEATAASYPDTVEARHLMHIAATRAAHQLWLMAAAQPSPLLPRELVE